MTDMTAHLTRQAAFSRATFGPGPRTEGVTNHIGKELVEVARAYEGATPSPGGTAHMDAAAEWTDGAILGLDGLTRAIWAAQPGWTADMVALEQIVSKGAVQMEELRTADPTKAIEHTRGIED